MAKKQAKPSAFLKALGLMQLQAGLTAVVSQYGTSLTPEEKAAARVLAGAATRLLDKQ